MPDAPSCCFCELPCIWIHGSTPSDSLFLSVYLPLRPLISFVDPVLNSFFQKLESDLSSLKASNSSALTKLRAKVERFGAVVSSLEGAVNVLEARVSEMSES